MIFVYLPIFDNEKDRTGSSWLNSYAHFTRDKIDIYSLLESILPELRAGSFKCLTSIFRIWHSGIDGKT